MILRLLDTNVCVALLRGKSEGLRQKVETFAPMELALSVMTLAELEVGVAKSDDPVARGRDLMYFCAPFLIVPFDDVAARIYGRVRAQLEKPGFPIGSIDMLIAAHALALDVPVVTNNEREFRRVPELKVENWLKL